MQEPTFSLLSLVIPIIVIFFFYFLPTILAFKRDLPDKTIIFLINIFGGLLLGAGWLLALILVYIQTVKMRSTEKY